MPHYCNNKIKSVRTKTHLILSCIQKTIKILKFLCYTLLFTFSFQFVHAQSTYYFEGREIEAGTKQYFLVPISAGKDSTFIPITIFNGAKNGKTLGITAGVHGYEYSPKKISLRRLREVLLCMIR